MLTLVQYFVVVVIIANSSISIINVTERQSVSLNCTIRDDGSHTWERRDGIEIENAKRKVTLLSLFSINVYLIYTFFIFRIKRKKF